MKDNTKILELVLQQVKQKCYTRLSLCYLKRNGQAFHDPTIKGLGVLLLHLSGREKEEYGPQEDADTINLTQPNNLLRFIVFTFFLIHT